jgi:crotonobetainyl-CoA:carnitine CoA-transferase CaiB-like acyl-CoA transferase
MASEAVLQAALRQRMGGKGVKGVQLEVALSSAAEYLALPRQWGLTQPNGFVGGAHAGYGVYACRDGRVAVAALEPHFAAALCAAAGVAVSDVASLQSAATRAAITRFLKKQTRAQLDALALAKDIPLHTMA